METPKLPQLPLSPQRVEGRSFLPSRFVPILSVLCGCAVVAQQAMMGEQTIATRVVAAVVGVCAVLGILSPGAKKKVRS